MLRIGSLFSGIGGLDLGLERAGVGSVAWMCEIDPSCRSVLSRHWPAVTIYQDVRSVDHEAGPIDVLCGGFPCQDISVAGKGAGLEGARSGLWFEYARIVRALRPRIVVVENVSALLFRGLDRVLFDLASLGYNAIWLPLRASDVGAPHRRQRIFVVAWLHLEPKRIPDADGIGLRELAERCGIGPCSPDERHAKPFDVGASDTRLADSDGSRLEIGQGVRCHDDAQRKAVERGCDALANPDRLRKSQPQGGERNKRRWLGNGSPEDVTHEWPPGPSDHEAWAAYLERHPGRAPADQEGRLNPTFVEALMGFPGNWTHGKRRERLKMLGNAVVPQVAEVVGALALEVLRRAESF